MEASPDATQVCPLDDRVEANDKRVQIVSQTFARKNIEKSLDKIHTRLSDKSVRTHQGGIHGEENLETDARDGEGRERV
jgi:hypothetical protein